MRKFIFTRNIILYLISDLDVTYALHYLPVLATLLLYGHVRKGDNIDLPLPHPGAWVKWLDGFIPVCLRC
jgi:hypothetical protein